MSAFSTTSKKVGRIDRLFRARLQQLAHQATLPTVWIVCAILAGSLLAGPSYGGVEAKVVTTDHSTDPATESRGTMLLSDGNLAMDLGLGPKGVQEAEKGQSTTIYQASSKNVVVLDHGKKAYSVMDDEALKLIGEEMEIAMMKLDQQIAGLPPEQRKILQDSLRGSQTKAETRVVSSDEVATKAGFSTRKFEVFQGEERIREVWVVDWDQVPEAKSVQAALQGFEGFFQQMQKMFDSISAGSLGGMKIFDVGENPFQDLSQMNGFPVLTRNYKNGALTTETRIESLEKSKIDPGAFEPPKTYTRRSMNGDR